MDDFFISVVSDSNHWMFISTRGGLSAGRTDCDSALFPYYTEDKIRDNSDNTGSRTIVIADQGGKRMLWEPSLALTQASTASLETSTRMYSVTSSFLKRPITILVCSLLIHGRPRIALAL